MSSFLKLSIIFTILIGISTIKVNRASFINNLRTKQIVVADRSFIHQTIGLNKRKHQFERRRVEAISLSVRKQINNNGKSGKISSKRRQQLGIPDSEEEYDLDVALNTNTDTTITKIIAGSFILAVIALLVVGVIIPSTTDFGEGVCSPIQNGGRC